MNVGDAVREVLAGAPDEAFSEPWDTLERAAYQEPETLQPYLRMLFGVADGDWRILEAWRAADAETIALLFTVAGGDDDKAAERALRALTHTRRRDVIERVVTYGSIWGRRQSGGLYVREVGYEDYPELRKLHCDTALHVAFPHEILCALRRRPETEEHPFHPTFKGFDSQAPSFRFGGQGETPCGTCHEPIDHVMTLDPVPEMLGLSTKRLVLGVCLSCVFEQNGVRGRVTDEPGAFFRHDDLGRPSSIDVLDIAERPERRSAPFVETNVRLVDQGPRFRVQTWGGHGEESVFRLGGAPTWVQDAGYQRCPSCSLTMTFLMQLDSNLPTTDGDEYWWANGGMAYVSFCDACRVSHFQLQFT